MKRGKLPTKLSDLLELALRDLISCERSPRYRVNMDQWHVWRPKQKVCEVCLAGAVIARTLNWPIEKDMRIDVFSTHDDDRLDALDSLRLGYVSEAGELIGLSVRRAHRLQELDRRAAEYGKSRASQLAFRRNMRELIRDLRAIRE